MLRFDRLRIASMRRSRTVAAPGSVPKSATYTVRPVALPLMAGWAAASVVYPAKRIIAFLKIFVLPALLLRTSGRLTGRDAQRQQLTPTGRPSTYPPRT